MRDAVSAGIFLIAFNEHCDRVRMGNIAQTNNVLQAMILTDGPKMIVTPTYHVFEMYKVHQGATYLPSDLTCRAYKRGDQELPSLVASASRAKSGLIHITVCNLDAQKPAEFVCNLEGAKVNRVSGRVLTAETMNARNTFDEPEAVKPVALDGFTVQDGTIKGTLPARSVSVLTVQ
jgi:alpha-N-arabinofuranosidase